MPTHIFVMIAAIVLLAAALYFLILYGVYRAAFGTKGKKNPDPMNLPKGSQYDGYADRMKSLVRTALEIPYEEVRIKSFDGLTLFGRYYEGKPGASCALLFHGYRSAGVRDFAGGLQILKNEGYHVILPDERAIGKSGGTTISFGINERQDVKAWAEYANRRFEDGTPLMLYGISLGGATVLMALSEELPVNVKGVAADCPYAVPRDIILKVAQDRHYPLKAVWFLVKHASRVFGHFDIEACNARDAAAGSDLPILLIHGTGDRFVPADCSREIYAACGGDGNGRVQLELFPGAAHGISFLQDEDRYKQVITEFLRKVTGWDSAGN